jgi:hypothetical protein
MVTIEQASMGERKIRIAFLPLEASETGMAKFGDVRSVQEETWSRQYIYAVSNGVRLVDIRLKHHVPSHLMIAGHRVLVSYEGQPVTCYNCSEQGHQYVECPYRRSCAQFNASQ